MDVQDQLGPVLLDAPGRRRGACDRVRRSSSTPCSGPVREQLTARDVRVEHRPRAGGVRARMADRRRQPAGGQAAPPYYLPQGTRVRAVRARLAQAPAAAAQGPDRLRQDPLRRPHGAPAGPAAAHGLLPRRPDRRRPHRPLAAQGRRDGLARRTPDPGGARGRHLLPRRGGGGEEGRDRRPAPATDDRRVLPLERTGELVARTRPSSCSSSPTTPATRTSSRA